MSLVDVFADASRRCLGGMSLGSMSLWIAWDGDALERNGSRTRCRYVGGIGASIEACHCRYLRDVTGDVFGNSCGAASAFGFVALSKEEEAGQDARLWCTSPN